MRTLLEWKSMALTVCLLALTWTNALRAAPEPPGATPLERKTLDEHIYKSLHDIINKGADLYNSGDRNGCYRLWEGALLALQPLLDHRPEMQKAITTAIDDARRNPSLARRAFVLRDAIDALRNDIHPEKKNDDAGKPTTGGGKTIWERLGGEANVKQVVDDFVEMAALDNKVDFDRGGKYPLTEEKIKHLKQMLVELISANTGGPYKKYTGKDMKTVHKDMAITDAEFNALAADLKKALEKGGAKPEDVKAVLDVVATTRKDIVEKPENPKNDKKEDKRGDKTASVSGKISFNGKPLVDGSVVFYPKEGKPVSGAIQTDGSYKADAIQPGVYRIAIDPGLTPAGAIPKKYEDPDKSGLKITVGTKRQSLDLNLSD
jgi:hemoglobin